MDGAAVFQADGSRADLRESVDKPRQKSSQESKGTNGSGAITAARLNGESHGADSALPERAAGGEADLLGHDQIRDLFQNERGIAVRMDRTRDDKLTLFGKATLADRYLMDGESYQDLFARVAAHFADDTAHAQRLYDYMSKLWFMPATPVLSNGGTKRGLPISCFLNEASDSLEGILDLRSIGERVGHNGKTSGVIPFIRVMDSLTLAISQGSLRRGSAAVYLPVSHPEIEEFIELRRPTGGDPNRKALNLHHGLLISDAFMRAVEADEDWALMSPKNTNIVRKVKARDLWVRILTARIETGEPYLVFIDQVNRQVPEHQKLAGLTVKMSNLCSEITLPTGPDHLGEDRTAVCCLSSLNLETFFEWQHEEGFIEDVMRFLDNVLSDFIRLAPDSMARARYSAGRERSVGLGVMGFHSFLQQNGVPLEGVMAKVWNNKIFKYIRAEADIASQTLAEERGACPDAEEFGFTERFSNKMAIAPTASISIICGGASPGIEPVAANSFTHKTLSGSFNVRNRYLSELLEEKGQNNEAVWSSITLSEGSVQHLDFLTQDEKDLFKTAFELDQRWLIELAADRSPQVCQSQSLNLFLRADVHKRELHQLHFQAWKKGVKSLYYCRSKSVQRAESAIGDSARPEAAIGPANGAVPLAGKVNGHDRPAAGAADQPSTDYEECLACQ